MAKTRKCRENTNAAIKKVNQRENVQLYTGQCY